nr:retrotransposon protein, putative, Ty1-copia subclass [Tanacetum cinerariifolium]
MDQSDGLRMFGSDSIKLERMDGMNFTRWKEKMKFLLTAFKVHYVLKRPQMGVLTEEEQRKRDQDETLYLPPGSKAIGCRWVFRIKYHTDGSFKLLRLDDILIVGTNMKGNNETKKFRSSYFQMKDMNGVDTILRIKVKRYSEGYAFNHCHYIDKIIDKFQHLNIEEANIPYESSCKLVENDERVVAQIEYASPIGYSDASWITGSSDSKSTTGWIFTLGGEAVCWGSKKQTCITHSTMEAEFLALATAGKEAEWLRNMLFDIELWPQPVPAISLHCDRQSTLSKAYNKVYNR